MRFLRVFLVLITVLIVTHGCGPKQVSPVQFGPSSSTNRVLFATEDTEFKNAILENVARAFNGRDVFIQVTDIPSLEKIHPKNYTAIVLVNTCIAWKVEPEIASFLKKVTQPEKVVLLTTTGNPDLSITAPDVDSVTSASQMEKAGEVSRDIINKVENILAQGINRT